MKQTLKNMQVNNKRIILRCDFNVPIKNGNVIDETKIIKSLDTINYLINENCKIIIISHLGRIKNETDKINNTLAPVRNSLERLLKQQVKFASDILSPETKQMALNLNPGEILLLENIRYLDYPKKLESTLNEEVAKYLASMGEIYVFDAFASAHRSHTSVVGIPKFLPNCIGFLVEKEIKALDSTIKDPERPFTVIMGGAKVDDKLAIIKSLLPKCDNLLLSGGLANSFLYTLGLSVGESLRTENQDIINELKQLMLMYKDKLALPLDAVAEATFNEIPHLKNINEIDVNDIIKDIGTKTIRKYSKIINASKTIFINGTVGIYEDKRYKNGTIEIFTNLKNCPGNVVIGGGDTITALNILGFSNDFQNISSGGGATLEYIAKGTLPGIEAINNQDEIETL